MAWRCPHCGHDEYEEETKADPWFGGTGLGGTWKIKVCRRCNKRE